ncbi:MAG: MBL fold metallo-hydrolase [Candidatus Omnitrophota bacterium]
MKNLGLKTFALGVLGTNSYVVYDKETRNAFIIDAPWPFDEINQFIEKEKLNVIFLLLTHGHFDHIGGLRGQFFPFAVHKDDDQLLKNSVMNGSIYFNSSVKIDRDANFFLEEKTPIKFDSFALDILHTPGHTPGSVCIKIGNWLFSGDTIFLGTVGRTDTPLGSCESLKKSIDDKIIGLPEDTIIYPGHGAPTTIERELQENPFLKK